MWLQDIAAAITSKDEITADIFHHTSRTHSIANTRCYGSLQHFPRWLRNEVFWPLCYNSLRIWGRKESKAIGTYDYDYASSLISFQGALVPCSTSRGLQRNEVFWVFDHCAITLLWYETKRNRKQSLCTIMPLVLFLFKVLWFLAALPMVAPKWGFFDHCAITLFWCEAERNRKQSLSMIMHLVLFLFQVSLSSWGDEWQSQEVYGSLESPLDSRL